MVEGLCEPMSPVELGGRLVDGVHDDESSRDRFACEERLAEGVGKQPRAKAGSLLLAIDRKAGDQDHADGVPRHPVDEARGRVGPLHRPHRQAYVADDPPATNHDEAARRVHLLGGECMAAQPAVKLGDAAPEDGNVVIRSEPFETQSPGAQRSGSGSAPNSATNSGTIVAGASRAA
jgi:hypothetical protein